MSHGRSNFDQRMLSGVDLVIDFATLGEYGLVPFTAAGSCREPTDRRSRPSRRPGWEALATIRRGACGIAVTSADASRTRAGRPAQPSADWRFPAAGVRRVDFRAAIERYAA
jgi:hypothetical protein